jgi:anti-sigma B factor antagonist
VGEEANTLRDRVKSLLADGKNKLVLNLHQVTLVDSAGLGTLVGLHHSTASCGARLRLSNLSTMLKEVLQVTRLLTVFEVSASEEDAVRALAEDA